MSVDNDVHKSNNWLDQWQSGKLGTGSRVYSFPRAFPSPTDVPVLLLNQPILLNSSTATWNLLVLYNEQKSCRVCTCHSPHCIKLQSEQGLNRIEKASPRMPFGLIVLWFMIFRRYCSFRPWASSPFGVVVKAARERTRECEGRSLAARFPRKNWRACS